MKKNKKNSLKDMESIRLEVKMPDGSKETVIGRFDELRIPSLPQGSGYYHYSIRHSDNDDSIPATLEKCTWVNHYGDFVCKKDLDGAIAAGGGFLEITEWEFFV